MKYVIDETLRPSYFPSVGSRRPVPMEWGTVVSLIKSDDTVRTKTLASREARRQGDVSRADDLKTHCGALTMSASCVGGHAKKHIQGLTGKLALDFDHIPVDRMAEAERTAKQDPSTFMGYVTNSGNGLRIVVRYQLMGDEATYMDAYDMAASYYEKVLGLEADRKTCDQTRLSFLSHDPEATFNPNATAFHVFGLGPLDKARREVESKGYVFTLHHHNEYVLRVAVWLRDHGVSLADALRSMQSVFNADYPPTAEVVRSVYANSRHAATHITSQKVGTASAGAKVARATVSDIKAYLASAARLRRNAVTREVEIGTGTDDWRLLSDTDVNSLWAHMCEEVCPARVEDIWAVIRSDATPEYDPFREYIDALPAWHPDTDPDHIGLLARRVHTTSPADFFDTCFRKWFVGILASLFTEATNQVILVFLGKQGIYKTTFFQRLLPPEWQKRYFYTKTNSQVFDKDDKIVMASHVLINLEEIDRMSPNELNQLKAFVTEKDIHVRPPYGHAPEHFRHIASFCGTGNNLRFLTDTTGNRRWLPFEVESIDSPYDIPIDYNGLYAQAWHLLQSGFNYWFSQQEINDLAAHNIHYEAPNAEAELIDKYFRLPQPGEEGVFLTATEVVDYLGKYTSLRGLNAVKVGKALSMLGYSRVHGKIGKGYWMVKNSLQDIAAEDQRTGSDTEVLPF